VIVLSPMTLQTPLLKKLTNHAGAASSVAAATAAVFVDGDTGDLLPMMRFDRAEEVGGAERKEDVVTSSM
jgi:hypothetical protein